MQQLTIAELAERTGVSVRTIRFYAGMGLLPPPEVHGRRGLYDDRHVARLELVRDLQGLGFTLSAIERYLARIPTDRAPEDLALDRALLAPWLPEQSESVDRAQLDQRAGRHLDDEDLDRLAALGVLRRDGEALELVRPDALDHGVKLLETDMDFEVQLASQKIIEKHTGALASELFDLFDDSVLADYRARGRPPEQRDRILATVEQIKPITVQGVVTHFQLAVNRAIRDSVAAETADTPTTTDPCATDPNDRRNL